MIYSTEAIHSIIISIRLLHVVNYATGSFTAVRQLLAHSGLLAVASNSPIIMNRLKIFMPKLNKAKYKKEKRSDLITKHIYQYDITGTM